MIPGEIRPSFAFLGAVMAVGAATVTSRGLLGRFHQTPVGKDKNARRVFFDYPFASDTTGIFEVREAQVSLNRPPWGDKNSTVFFSPHALILKVRVHYVEAETMSGPHRFSLEFVSRSTAFFSPHQLVTVQKGIIVDYERLV